MVLCKSSNFKAVKKLSQAELGSLSTCVGLRDARYGVRLSSFALLRRSIARGVGAGDGVGVGMGMGVGLGAGHVTGGLIIVELTYGPDLVKLSKNIRDKEQSYGSKAWENHGAAPDD